MALVQVNPGRGQQPKESSLDKVLKAVQIAQGVMGTAIAIPEFLQKRDIAKGQIEGQKSEQQLREAQIKKIGAETAGIEAENTPLSEDQKAPFRKMGIEEAMIPGTVGAAKDLMMKAFETPAQKEARMRAEAQLNISMQGLELQKHSSKRQDQQFDYQQIKDAEEKAKKEQERFNETYVPDIGLAYTADDAKKLKEGVEQKKSFDRKLQEMIDLRKKNGFTVLDRAAVARGEQLSKDLLLIYKNMAKLGVLSRSDEAIINSIIPKNPLGIGLTAKGEDPIMKQLTGFMGDVNEDFKNTVRARIREPEVPRDQANAPETKTVGGKTYIKVEGGWQAQ